MKKNILAAIIALAAVSSAHANHENTISCASAIYGIQHQSCVLNLPTQEAILEAEKCTADDNYDNYKFYINGKVISYSIDTCSFN